MNVPICCHISRRLKITPACLARLDGSSVRCPPGGSDIQGNYDNGCVPIRVGAIMWGQGVNSNGLEGWAVFFTIKHFLHFFPRSSCP